MDDSEMKIYGTTIRFDSEIVTAGWMTVVSFYTVTCITVVDRLGYLVRDDP